MPDNPFDAAVNAAGKLTSQAARDTLLSEIAEIQFGAGLLDEPLKIVELIESPLEKKNVLRNAALDFIAQKKNFDVLPQIIRMMITADRKNKYFAGQTALMLLEIEPPQIETALQVLKTTDEPFDSDIVRYDFITKILKTGGKNYKDAAKNLLHFRSADYSDWGSLSLMKASAGWAEWDEAEKIADSFSDPLRKSWAFLELSRIVRKETSEDAQRRAEFYDDYFVRAVSILSGAADKIPKGQTDKEQKTIQRTAVQIRIFGKEVLRRYGDENLGAELLESAEEIAAGIASPFERCRQQLFIAKVLREHRELDYVKDYVNVKILEDKTLSGIDRSRIIQWLIEAGLIETGFLEAGQTNGIAINNIAGSITWTGAVQTAAEAVPKTPFIASDELNQVKRIAEILRRFVNRKQIQKQTQNQSETANGNPKDDINRLSGEEYEEYYYSPFAIEDCGC